MPIKCCSNQRINTTTKHLKEVNFKTMESKILPNVYFAGEILNIDAITGGFNFQNAWTGGFIVAENIVK